MVQQYSTINHLNMHVHDSEATLARHVARFDAIATSCGSATPWQSLNRLSVGHCIESDTSAMSVHRTCQKLAKKFKNTVINIFFTVTSKMIPLHIFRSL